MALQRISPSQSQEVKKGRPSGGVMGRKVGAGLGAVIGGVTGGVGGFAAGGPAGAAVGAAKGAGTGLVSGAGTGQVVGDLIQPAQAGQVINRSDPGVNPVSIAQQSQAMLDGLRSLERLSPELQQRYAGQLTEGYIQSMVQLKTMGQ